MLNVKQFPYLFTILVALIGWTVNHISNNILSSKVLEYDMSFSNKVSGIDKYKRYNNLDLQLMKCKLTNLSNDHLFENIHLSFVIDNNNEYDKMYFSTLVAIKPLFYKETEPDTIDGKITHFDIEALHPRSSAIISIYYKSSKQPCILLEVHQKAKRNVDKPILLLEANYETRILKNENTIFFVLLIIWFILISLYFYQFSRGK